MIFRIKNLITFCFILSMLSVHISCEKDEVTEETNIAPSYVEVSPEGYPVYESGGQKFWLDTIIVDVERPWAIQVLPNGDVLYNERKGVMTRFVAEDKALQEISGLPDIVSVGQGGLLDLILDQSFETNSMIFFSYSKRVGNKYTTAVAKARLEGNTLQQFEEIFEASPAYSTTHHFGSRIQIIDDFLFLTVGDRGYLDHAQRLDRHNGKVMRIDLNGVTPSDNPFVSTSGSKAEIWSYGHRNPQGLFYDSERDVLWSHEHGPKGGDEINIVEKGLNYGWPEITYGIDYDGTVISNDTAKDGMEQPISYWDPSIAPCGLVVCNSEVYPEWKGDLFIGGLAAQSLYRVEIDGESYKGEDRLLEGIGRVRTVSISKEGYLYIGIENPGIIFRLVPTD